MISQNISNNSYDVYDEVLEYLLGEGHSFEESNRIMVELINEGGLGSLLKGALKFAQKRASTPVKTAVTDLATTAIATGGAPVGKVTAAAVKSTSPAPIVRTVKGSSVRTPPRAPSPDPWKQSGTVGRTKDVTKTQTPKPSSQRDLPGAPSPKALSGSPSRQSLPSSTSSRGGGAIVPSSPAGKLVKQTQKSTEIVKTSPAGKLAKQTQKSTDIVKTSPAGKLAKQTQRSSSVTSSSRRVTSPTDTTVKPVNVRVVNPETQSSRSLAGVEQPRKLLPSGKTTKPAAKRTTTPPSGSSGTSPNLGKRLKNILKAGAVAGTAASALSPTSTADETRSTAERKGLIAPPAPKLPAPETTKVKQKASSTPKSSAPETSATIKSPKAPKVVTQKPKTIKDTSGLKWPPLTPPPPVEKRPSISKDLEDIRGAIQRSKERQKTK